MFPETQTFHTSLLNTTSHCSMVGILVRPESMAAIQSGPPTKSEVTRLISNLGGTDVEIYLCGRLPCFP